MNHFVLPITEYKRDLNLIRAYCEQNALYLSRMTGTTYEAAMTYVRQTLGENGEFELRSPDVSYLAKETPGNRKLYTGNFLDYLQNVIENDHILAPTMTVFYNTTKLKSLLGEYIKENMGMRKKFKKEMFSAKMDGNKVLERFKNVLQSSSKIKNNSLSGAHGSSGNILYNKSSHPTLTSTCRAATGYGNANNEKFLMGNRHYWSSTITKANILAIVTNTDYAALELAMLRYSLHYPTPEEAMECVLYSSNIYWRDPKQHADVFQLLVNLTPVERAAFVYIGDMHHLAKYNANVVRDFLTSMSYVPTEPVENAERIVGGLSGDVLTLTTMLCSKIMSGKKLGDIKKENPAGYALLAATGANITRTLEEYKDLIRGVWVTRSLPASVYSLPGIMRKAVLVSDTDSTIFSNDYWTQWYVGRLDWSEKSYHIGYVTTFLASQMVIHLLAMMSANIGIAKDQLHQLTMKNEYYFPVFGVTGLAKHYYAYKSAQEGNVYKEMELEIKGKNLRDSTLPAYVTEKIRDYVKGLMDTIMARGSLTLKDVYGPIAAIENNIIDNVKAGKYCDMPSINIKEAKSYADAASSAYLYHDLWENVFAPKYGQIDKPPYKAIRVQVDLGNPTKLKNWLATMPDQELANRFRDWMVKNKKLTLEQILLPLSYLEVHGIPPEIIPVINLRKLVYGTTMPFYIILESLGIYLADQDYTRMISDFYPPKDGIAGETLVSPLSA